MQAKCRRDKYPLKRNDASWFEEPGRVLDGVVGDGRPSLAPALLPSAKRLPRKCIKHWEAI